jgi:hypothetical protein
MRFSSKTAPVLWPRLNPGNSPDRDVSPKTAHASRENNCWTPFFLEGSRQLERFSARIHVVNPEWAWIVIFETVLALG